MLSLEQPKTIKFILTRQEQGAVFMAAVYGRITGNPACCPGTPGPGSTNLITGVADANMDRAPMLVLTGQGATSLLHKESHQVMNVVEMFDLVTKRATTAWNADSIPEIVCKAVRLTRTEKPGAVHIELPEDIAKHDVDAVPMHPKRYGRSVPEPEVIHSAFEKIQQAKNPVVLAGNGCIRKRSNAQLREFCELTGIGVMVWEDDAYGLIARKQDNDLGKHSDLSFGNPDCFSWHKLSAGPVDGLKIVVV